MIDASFVEAIAGNVQPQVHKLRRGQQLVIVDGKAEIVGTELLAEPKTLEVSTLSAIVAAVKAGIQDGNIIAVHVASPTKVNLVAPSVGDDKQQFVFLSAEADVPQYRYGYFDSLDMFIITLQASYSHTADRDRALQFVGGLTAGLAAEMADNGAAQFVTTKRGITRAGDPTAFDNPVFLSPFRTFPEVEQPVSPFVLRLKQVKDGETLSAQAALFEADGGAWKREAVQSIGEYFTKALPEVPVLA